MKRKLFSISLSVAILLTACTKEDSLQDESLSSAKNPDNGLTGSARSVALATNWEYAQKWSTSTSDNSRTFYFNRAVPNLTADVMNNGVAMVWIRNFSETNPELMGKYVSLPFIAFAENERPYWQDSWDKKLTEGNFMVQLKSTKPGLVNGTEMPYAKTEFRYFIIPPSVLSKKGISAADVKTMEYYQMVNTFGVSE